MLVSVLGEQELRSGRFQSKTLKERVYANAYLTSPYKSIAAASLRERLIKGSKTFLERQFMDHIESSVASNPAEANLGGVPSLVNTVRAFVQLKYLRYGSWSQPNLEVWNSTLYFIESTTDSLVIRLCLGRFDTDIRNVADTE